MYGHYALRAFHVCVCAGAHAQAVARALGALLRKWTLLLDLPLRVYLAHCSLALLPWTLLLLWTLLMLLDIAPGPGSAARFFKNVERAVHLIDAS